jgi:hypothetical protein
VRLREGSRRFAVVLSWLGAAVTAFVIYGAHRDLPAAPAAPPGALVGAVVDAVWGLAVWLAFVWGSRAILAYLIRGFRRPG